MSLFRQFLVNTEKTHRYRLKTVVELDDALMVLLEKYLHRFRIVDISGVNKTIHQSFPIDFPNVTDREVYWVDFELEQAVSPYVLQQHIYRMFGTNDSFVLVNGENDPRELERQRLEAVKEMDDEAYEDGEKPACLMDNPDYPEAIEHDSTDFYGDRYNLRLRDALEKIDQDTMARYGAKNIHKPFDWLVETESEDDLGTTPAETTRDVAKVGGYSQNYENTKEYKRAYSKDGDKAKAKKKTVHVTTPEYPA